MIVTTLEGIAGRMTESTLGAVRGTSMWTKRLTKTSLGGIRHMQAFGLQDVGAGLNEAKELATKEIQQQALRLGADAVVGFRLEVIEMSNGVFCVNASGTAVHTVALPQSVPDFSQADGGLETDGDDFVMPSAAILAGRPSFQGSVLRH
jgi:uncharacterized protein YbjQ (UPF0145 family)